MCGSAQIRLQESHDVETLLKRHTEVAGSRRIDRVDKEVRPCPHLNKLIPEQSLERFPVIVDAAKEWCMRCEHDPVVRQEVACALYFGAQLPRVGEVEDRKSTRLNSSHSQISY